MMMTTEAAVPAVKIEDRFVSKEIEGRLIGNVTTRAQGKPRWAVIEVYSLDAGGWLVHKTGYSRVYHQPDTTCRTAKGTLSGELTTAADLQPDPLSCNDCEPPYPDELDETSQVRVEFPRHSFDEFHSWGNVFRFLTDLKDRDTGHRATFVSEPVADLLRQCRGNDVNVASAPIPVDRIGHRKTP